jgi:TolB-like protein/Tfp pilus assembly protein PilF
MAAQTIVAPDPLNMAPSPPARPANPPEPHAPGQEDRLDSWKEIAAFLKRGVRTVQRWERTEALPVRRHQHAKLGSVYALKSEVAAWWESRGTRLEDASAAAQVPGVRRRAEGDVRRRLLVLPFENLSGDAQQDYLSDGLTEEMITGLARLQPERLSVIARSTALTYKSGASPPRRADQIAAELDLDYILEGSVRASGGRIRVTAQLVDAREHTHLWAQNYDRDLRDVLEVQADVAAAIAREVRLAIAPAERTAASAGRAADAETYQAFLMGRYLLNQMTAASLAGSLEWFARAIGREPTHALSHAGIAQAYGLLATVPFDALPAHEAMPKAAAAARKALELDASLPEAHAALGLVLHHYEWNWAEAEKEYQRALELNPDYTAALLRYAWLLLALGRSDEALARIARAQEIAEEIDPHLLVVVRATRASALYFARKFDAVIAECREALKLDARFYLLHYLLSRALARTGRRAAAVAALARAKSAWKDVPLVAAGAGLAYAIAGRKAEATRILRRLEAQRKRRNIPATYIGIVYAGLGDFDAAFEWLERAFEERADGLTLLNAEPLGERFRADPRFQSLVRRIGLP